MEMVRPRDQDSLSLHQMQQTNTISQLIGNEDGNSIILETTAVNHLIINKNRTKQNAAINVRR